MTDSKNVQENTVSAGFALGIALRGEQELHYQHSAHFDLAFWRAWRHWEFSNLFPAISQQREQQFKCLKPSVFVNAYRARKQKPASSLYWEHQSIRPTAAWDPQDVEDAAARVSEEIPASAWKKLVDDTLGDIYK